MIRTAFHVAALSAAALLAATGCDDAAGDDDATDVVADFAPEDDGRDATEDADASPPDDGADEWTSDAVPPCLDPGRGTPDAPVSVASGSPSLSGGTIADGTYALASVTLHPDGAVSDNVTVFRAYSNGDTRGALEIRDGAWGLNVNLDLWAHLSIVPVGGTELDMPARYRLAGPIVIADGSIDTEAGTCAAVAPAECGIAGPVRYEADADSVVVELVWSQECLISIVPVGYDRYARTWLEGDLPILLRFSR